MTPHQFRRDLTRVISNPGRGDLEIFICDRCGTESVTKLGVRYHIGYVRVPSSVNMASKYPTALTEVVDDDCDKELVSRVQES